MKNAPHLPVDLERLRVQPGARVKLAAIDPRDTQGIADKVAARSELARNRRLCGELQERLFAESKQSLLLVLQAMDTGGKDSTIRNITRGINPQGCVVVGFKKPCPHELARDFLWRVHAAVPPRGVIGIFNRSHYEDVLIVRVHGWADPATIEARYGHINAFEALLAERGTRVVKVMLHISKEYQLTRLRRRLAHPDKHWKFNPDDLGERELWDDYMKAFEVALARCSTAAAPWYVVPAERRWFRDLVVSRLLLETLQAMDPRVPEASFDTSVVTPESLH